MNDPRWNTGDDAEFDRWRSSRSPRTPATPDDAEFEAWKAKHAPKPTLGEKIRRGVDMATNASTLAAAGRTMLADVVSTVPRVVSGIAGLQADYLERDTPKRSLTSLITGEAPQTPGIVGDVARTYRRVGDAAGDIANRVEEWGRPRDGLGMGAKLLTGIGKYAAMGPVAGVAVGAAEAAADPRFSQTSLVAELEKIQRPGMLGDAARAVGRGASWLNETEVGRAVGDVVIGEVGSRVLTSTARGLAKAGGAAERTAARALDRLNPIPDDVLEVATREGLPRSGRLTPERFDEFAREIPQPPQRDPGDVWRTRKLLPPREDALGALAAPQQGPLTLGQTIARAGREASPTFAPRTTPDVSGSIRGRGIEQAEAAIDLPTAAEVGDLRARRMEVGGPESTELYSVGSTPAFVSAAKRVAASPVASAATGAVVGASIDDENPGRGALIGATLGGGASVLAKRAAKAGAPLRLTGDADIDAVLGTIARGERDVPVRDAMLSGAKRAYTKLVDELYPLREFGRTVGGSSHMSDVATQASGWQSAAHQRARDGLQPILKATAKNREPVMALAKAQRALALLDSGLEKTDIPRDVLERTVQKLSADPAAAEGARQLQDYYRQLLQRKLDEGVLTREAFDAITESGDYYTPFTREFNEPRGGGRTAGAGGRFVNRGTGVRKMDANTASAKTIDPFEQAALDTFETEQAVAKQRVSNVLAATVEANDVAAYPWIRRVESQQAGRDGRVVAANIGGDRRYYEVADKDLYDAWASFDPKQQSLWVSFLAPFKRARQVGVTLMPDFAVANAMRDNVMTALQYPLKSRGMIGGGAAGAVVGASVADEGERWEGAAKGAGIGMGAGAIMPNIVRTLGAMRAIVTDDEVYKQWMRDGGGGFGGFYPRDTKGARKLIGELERTGVSAADIVSPSRWVDALRYIGGVAEQAPRLAAYTDALAKGADASGAVAKSADISLDFSKIGSHAKGVAATTAFWNAKVQGWDKLARMLKNPKTWAQGAAMITVPSVALWTINKDNPEYWERPQWERNLFWLIPKGGDAGGFWRIPKPFEVGYLFASVPERILDYAQERDPEALQSALRDMMSTASDGTIPLIPTGAEPFVENMTNHSFFRNRPIVTNERVLPERQFDDRTSSIAVGLGGATGTSPQKIDNVMRGFTGGAGAIALDVTDRIARATGLDDRPLPPDRATVPVVGDLTRRFSTRDGGMSDSESLFWQKFKRAEQARASVRDMLKDQESPEAVRAFILDHADDLRDYETLKETRDALEKVKAAERQVLADRTMPRERKRQVQMKLRQLATQFAQGSARGDVLAEQDR